MKSGLILILALTTLTLSAQKRFIVFDSTRIRINTIGLENRKPGQPVVVFESGLGTPMDNWDRVLPGVSELAPVFTYDRPGIGESDPDKIFPGAKNVSDRLIRILNSLGITPPYVLVGHSLGGAYVRGFAAYYPELLAGLVIIDPADFTETRQNRRQPFFNIGLSEVQTDTLFAKWHREDLVRRNNPGDKPQSIIAEEDALAQMRETGFAEINGPPLPDLPVHIITSGRYDTPPALRRKELNDSLLFRAKMKCRIERWTDVVQSVSRGMLFYSGDAGHFVQWDDPELVIFSIRTVLQDRESMMKSK